MSESEVIKNMEAYCAEDNPTPSADKQKYFAQLAKVMAKGPTEPTADNFKYASNYCECRRFFNAWVF